MIIPLSGILFSSGCNKKKKKKKMKAEWKNPVVHVSWDEDEEKDKDDRNN